MSAAAPFAIAAQPVMPHLMNYTGTFVGPAAISSVLGSTESTKALNIRLAQKVKELDGKHLKFDPKSSTDNEQRQLEFHYVVCESLGLETESLLATRLYKTPGFTIDDYVFINYSHRLNQLLNIHPSERPEELKIFDGKMTPAQIEIAELKGQLYDKSHCPLKKGLHELCPSRGHLPAPFTLKNADGLTTVTKAEKEKARSAIVKSDKAIVTQKEAADLVNNFPWKILDEIVAPNEFDIEENGREYNKDDLRKFCSNPKTPETVRRIFQNFLDLMECQDEPRILAITHYPPNQEFAVSRPHAHYVRFPGSMTHALTLHNDPTVGASHSTRVVIDGSTLRLVETESDTSDRSFEATEDTRYVQANAFEIMAFEGDRPHASPEGPIEYDRMLFVLAEAELIYLNPSDFADNLLARGYNSQEIAGYLIRRDQSNSEIETILRNLRFGESDIQSAIENPILPDETMPLRPLALDA